MFRTLPLHAMRQKQRDAAQPSPLVFSCGNELVDNHLSSVPEIAELRLPQYKPVGRIETVSVFKTKHARFRHRSVVNVGRRLIRGEIAIREVLPAIFGIMQNGMPVAEGPAFGILA